MVVSPTHARGGTRDQLMTDVTDLVRVAVVAPLGNTDFSSLLAVILRAKAVSNLCVSMKDFLKHQVIGIHFGVQYRTCPGVTFGLLTILLRF